MRAIAGLLFALALAVVPSTAPAFCPSPFGPLPDQFYNNPAFVNPTESHLIVGGNRPYWMVLAAAATAGPDMSDYDVTFYRQATGGAEPVCFSGWLGTSAGTTNTDFVVGDFNHNPYANYYARVNCYSGDCSQVSVQWRNGGTVLTVNSAPLTVTSTLATNPKPLVNIYDVYLTAGTHYYFNFQPTGDLQHKMLLFRNPTGGVYWAGRSAAVFETAGCATYDAPSTGYYGLVVVADQSPNLAEGAFSISVTTQPVCSCPVVLESGVPVSTASPPGFDHKLAIMPFERWEAVALRSSTDWDLFASSPRHDHPNVNCAGTLRGQSAQNSDPVELLVADGNARVEPDTLHVTSATFSGGQPAAIEMHAGHYAPSSEAWKMARSWGTSDLVEVWDVPLRAGVAYRISLQSFGPSARALLFRNTSGPAYVAGLVDAVLSTRDTATYVSPSTENYALVLLHDDEAGGGVLLEGGSCATAPPLVENTPTSVFPNLFTSFTPTLGNWTLATVVGPYDFDVALFGNANGTGYPDCYGAPGASSNGSGTAADFVVGDTHGVPSQPVYARFLDFTLDPSHGVPGIAEWRQARIPVAVNGPAVSDDLASHVGAVHEVFLQAGSSYTIELMPPAGGTQKAFLFGHTGSGPYWAPRSAALASTGGTTSLIAPYTGSYVLVVVNEDVYHDGTTSLRVTGPVTGVESAAPPARTRLAAAGPNPARGAMALRWELAKTADVSFDLVDVAGRSVSRLDLGRREAGAGEAGWNPRTGAADVPPGLYFLRFTADGRTVESRRITLTR